MRRTKEVTFRLAPPSVASSVEIVLSDDEHAAIVSAAWEQSPGLYCRDLILAAARPDDGQSAYAAARGRADACGLTLGAWMRLVVLMTIGQCRIELDVLAARACDLGRARACLTAP